MTTNIKTTNISLTDAISEYTSKRMAAIADLLKDDTTVKCDVELGRTTNHHNKGDIFRAEIHIVGKGRDHYASSEEEDLYKAIDMVRDEMLREVRSSKEKKLSLIRRSGAKIKNFLRGFRS
jgi:ribosomal subunit interface protein